MNKLGSFIETHQYKLFAEFCDSCAEHKYIGVCYGPPGVGETLSAERYSNWKQFSKAEFYLSGNGHNECLESDRAVKIETAFYTPSVAVNPRGVLREIEAIRERIRASSPAMAKFNRRREKLFNKAAVKREEERSQYIASQDSYLRRVNLPASCADYETSPTVYEVRKQSVNLREKIADPTRLIIIDEAERLSATSLEQVRFIYDKGGVGVILIGMPGLEKRLARYAQLSSRIGFVHKFNPLNADQVRSMWRDICSNYASLKKDDISDDAMTAIVRITRGNFRLLERLLSQIGRVVEINQLSQITLEAVEVARDNLVIGSA